MKSKICKLHKSIAKVCNTENFIKAYTCQFYGNEISIWPHTGKRIIGVRGRQKYIIQCFLQYNNLENLRNYVQEHSKYNAIDLHEDILEWLITNRIFAPEELIKILAGRAPKFYRFFQHITGYDNKPCEFLTFFAANVQFFHLQHLEKSFSLDEKIIYNNLKLIHNDGFHVGRGYDERKIFQVDKDFRSYDKGKKIYDKGKKHMTKVKKHMTKVLTNMTNISITVTCSTFS